MCSSKIKLSNLLSLLIIFLLSSNFVWCSNEVWHISAMMTALQKSESDKNFKHDLAKALEKLGKVHKEADIRSYMDKLLEKNGADMYVSAVDLSVLVFN